MAIKLSIRQQLEQALHAWLVASFSTATEFAGVTFSKGQQSGDVTMPVCAALCEEAQAEAEPGLGIFLVPAAVVLLTTIDAEVSPDAAHRARADAVANHAEDTDALKSFLNNSGLIYVFGFGPSKSTHAVQERHFVDRFELAVHCRCA